MRVSTAQILFVSSKVEVVCEPTWNPDFMTEAARLELGMF